jgi:ABC-2 type transport system ATP-binding protein
MPPAPPPSPVLRLDNVTKVYRRSHLGRVRETLAVQNVSLEVREGEVFGLLGLNGSGKTTTLKLLLGLIFPTEGKAEVLGRSAEDPEARRGIGYLPEVPYFYRHLSAREVLWFYGRLSGLAPATLKKRIEETLSFVRLAENAHRPMREYSKGMLQRTGLAQALLHDPRVLFFDEPVTGLDPLGLKEMRDMIAGLNKSGKTVLFSSHSISEVEKLCHRVGIMVKGRLARVVPQAEWESAPGRLEDIFVQTVSADPNSGLRPVEKF